MRLAQGLITNQVMVHNLALAFKELGKFDQSIESHKKAFEYESEDLSHYYYLRKFLNKLSKDFNKPDIVCVHPNIKKTELDKFIRSKLLSINHIILVKEYT